MDSKNPRWQAKDLQDTDRWAYELSFDEKSQIHEAAKGGHSLSWISQNFEAQIQQIRETLETGTAVFLLRGLPTLQLAEGQAMDLCIALGQALGTPVAQDMQGSTLVHIRATDAAFQDAISYAKKKDGSHARPYETRAAFCMHSDPCDVAGLLCLDRAAGGGDSLLVSTMMIHDVIQKERPDLYKELCRPYAYARPGRKGPGRWHDIPVFSWKGAFFKSHAVPDLIRLSQLQEGIPRWKPLQHEALDFLEEVAKRQDLCFRLALEPGDFLMVNNHLVFHGRDAYEDDENSTRHYLRLWLAMANSRPLHEAHERWFGDPRPGRIRGGYLR